jgi:hypothetical protein
MTTLCLTVDVEDFQEGMAVLGHDVPKRSGAEDGLRRLLERLEETDGRPKVTLFVVGRHAPSVQGALAEFAAAGHEIASHGPDHGRLPGSALDDWLRRGRETLEDLLGVPVLGFRSPRFDRPPGMELRAFRHALADAGFAYVSDTSELGPSSPVRELPVLAWKHLPIGGGSYQRLFPTAVVTGAVRRARGAAVCYYHSYDFDGTVPPLRQVRSGAAVKQVVGRGRIAAVFAVLGQRFGSSICSHVAQ